MFLLYLVVWRSFNLDVIVSFSVLYFEYSFVYDVCDVVFGSVGMSDEE